MHTQWIDALEFEDYGGFRPETQFVQEMGQGYLFALELPGIPVKDAGTHFTIPEAGMYRVWVRAKNWRKEAAPGRLKVLVDQAYLPRELGMLPTEQWCWEPVGDCRLEAGIHSLAVQDTTGYFGRFAAVLITDDMDFTPEHKMERLWRERAALRGEPLEPDDQGEWDVVVAGGGPAGIPAAIAAARKGMRVALLHSRPGLGGNASNEGTVGFDGAYCHHPYMRETGIAEEIRRMHDHDSLTWEDALLRLTQAEPSLTVFCNQFAVDAQTDGGRISSLKTIDCTTGRFRIYRGRMFIDCTGDGWVGYYAGAKYRLGREAKWQHQEPLAPEAPDNLTMSGCLMGSMDSRQILGYYAQDAGEPVPFNAPLWAKHLPEGSALHRAPSRLHTGEWWIENPTDMDDLWEQEAIRDELLCLNLGYFHWLKNTYDRRDLARNLKITGFGRYNARRENRRIIGDYVMTENDCRAGKSFPDAIAYCGWPIDVHHPRGIYSGADGPYFVGSDIPVTEIPFRCIYSKNISNLLMAGRCVSVSHLALGSVRVQNTLATLGQAAGTAAWLCLEKGITPRGIYEHHMEELQQILLRDDMYLPSVPNRDPADLARRANVTATSVSKKEPFTLRKGVTGGWAELDRPRAASAPADSPVFMEAYLSNRSGKPAMIQAKAVVMDRSGDYEHMEVLARVQQEIPDQFEGYVRFFTGLSAEKKAIGLLLEKAPGVFWREILYACDGRKRGEPVNDYRWDTDNSNSFDLRLGEEPFVPAQCGPENVVNGYSRIRDAAHYAWVSDPDQPLPQSLMLEWDRPQSVFRVHLAFDTDLTNPSYSYLSQPIVARTVRDYRIEARVEGTWIPYAEAKDNYLRFRVHAGEPVSADAIRITVTATNGDASARVMEVRVYGGDTQWS